MISRKYSGELRQSIFISIDVKVFSWRLRSSEELHEEKVFVKKVAAVFVQWFNGCHYDLPYGVGRRVPLRRPLATPTGPSIYLTSGFSS